MKNGKAFGYGVISGAVEPLGAVLTILLAAFVTPILPYMLSFAAGAMLYVSFTEILSKSQNLLGGDTFEGFLRVNIGFF